MSTKGKTRLRHGTLGGFSWKKIRITWQWQGFDVGGWTDLASWAYSVHGRCVHQKLWLKVHRKVESMCWLARSVFGWKVDEPPLSWTQSLRWLRWQHRKKEGWVLVLWESTGVLAREGVRFGIMASWGVEESKIKPSKKNNCQWAWQEFSLLAFGIYARSWQTTKTPLNQCSHYSNTSLITNNSQLPMS